MSLTPAQILTIRECTKDETCFYQVLDVIQAVTHAAVSSTIEGADLISNTVETEKPEFWQAQRIVIIDDNQAILDIVEAMLQPLGCNVTLFSSPKRALSALPKEEASVILLDVEMPEMDGGDVLQKIRTLPATQKTPVIFLTGLVSHEEAISLSRPGTDPYLPKPFTRDGLINAIRDALLTPTQVKQ